MMALSISSCGLLGTKNRPVQPGKVGETGCLNNSKDLVSRYVSGTLSQAEWKSTFDCINQSLDFFTEYVHGSTENSYTQGDMYVLISRFLITNKPVTPDLVLGAFELKQALLGGDSNQFTKAQIDLLKTALDKLEVITSGLIPYLKLRQDPNATYDELVEMIGAFNQAGDQLANYVSTLPVNGLSEQVLGSFIDQLTNTFDLPVIDGLNQKVFLIKWLMFNSTQNSIVGQDWPLIFRAAMRFGGIALAYQTSQTLHNPDNLTLFSRIGSDYHYREFIWSLLQQTKPGILASLTKHGGNIPFSAFDDLIDQVPVAFLNNIPKQQIKDVLRPLVQRLLMSQTQTGVDISVINTIFSLSENMVADLGLIDRFYEKSGIDKNEIQAAALRSTLTQYAGSLSGTDKTRFADIENLILTYQPALFRDSNSVMYQSGVGYSRFQNAFVLTLDRILTQLHLAYGSGNGFFTEDDFKGILEQPAYKAIFNSLTWVDATVPNFYAKRFHDIDTFTSISDGNGQVTIPEIINYAFIVISSCSLTTKMRNEITPRCDQNLGKDNMGWTMIPNQCFRNEFYKNLSYWLTYFPRLKAYWATLTPDKQAKAAIWLEHGSRRNGYGETNTANDWVGKFDFGAAAAVLHYTESLFTRFDGDHNEILSKNEINNAYPIFKNVIAGKVKLTSNDYILEGVFTYIVKYQAMPDTADFSGISTLALWLLSYTGQNYSTDRLGVFNIVCQLAAPENVTDPAATNARICQ